MEKSQITVGLLWHSVNSDNLGVGALTAAHISIVEEVARSLDVNIVFKVLQWRDQRLAYIKHKNLHIVPLRAKHFVSPFGGLYSAVRACDVILDISAGDSFSDIYGLRRFFFITLSKLIVLTARRPLILSPQTIGPFQRIWAQRIAVWLMRHARSIVTRDNLTTEYIAEIGLDANVTEATDVAFRLPFTKADGARDNITRIGLNVSGLLLHGGYTQDNMFKLAANYPELVRAMIQLFTGKRNHEVHLISHVISDTQIVEDDYRASQQLADEFEDVIVAPRFADPSEAKSYIATMDFFCGSRMHACIAAFSSGVPVLPLAYSRKFAGLFGSLDYPWLADCRSESVEQIMETVSIAYEQRTVLKAQIESSMKSAEKKLSAYEAVLSTCLTEILMARS